MKIVSALIGLALSTACLSLLIGCTRHEPRRESGTPAKSSEKPAQTTEAPKAKEEPSEPNATPEQKQALAKLKKDCDFARACQRNATNEALKASEQAPDLQEQFRKKDAAEMAKIDQLQRKETAKIMNRYIPTVEEFHKEWTGRTKEDVLKRYGKPADSITYPTSPTQTKWNYHGQAAGYCHEPESGRIYYSHDFHFEGNTVKRITSSAGFHPHKAPKTIDELR